MVWSVLPWSATELWKSRLAADGNCWPGKDHPIGQPTSPCSFHLHWQQVSSQKDPYPHLPVDREAKLTPQWWQGSSVQFGQEGVPWLWWVLTSGTHRVVLVLQMAQAGRVLGTAHCQGWKHYSCQADIFQCLLSRQNHKDKSVLWFQGLRVHLIAYYGKWLLCRRLQLLVEPLLLKGRLNKCSPIPASTIRFDILLALKLFL